MKDEWIRTLERFLEGLDFGKNWDGAYQDVVPTLTQFFQKQGFRTTIMNEWESESRETELIAMKEALVVRIPWAEDLQGRSVVNLQTLQVHQQIRSSAKFYSLPFKSVLFDAADTLFHTRGTVGEIYGSVARQYGSTVPFNLIQAAFVRQFRHSGPLSTANEKDWWKDVVHRVFSDVGMVPDFDKFFDQVYDKFKDSAGWTLFPETLEVLEELKEHGLKLGVISNFDSRVYTVMRSLDIFNFFDTFTISSESGFAKPHPGIFEAAIRALKMPASEILLVGDSLHDDVEAGARAGLTAILIDRFDRYPSATHVTRIASLNEVMPLIQQPLK